MSASQNAELDAAVANGRLAEVASICDRLELEAAAAGGVAQYSPLYSKQILGHLLNGNLSTAKLIWKRVPSPVKAQDVDTAAAWKLASALLRQDPSGVHAALRNHSWGAGTKALADALSAKYSSESLDLLGKTYSCILEAEAPALLGVSAREASAQLQAHGWVLDTTTGSYVPRALPKQADDALVLNQVQQLTEYVVHLE